MPETIQTQKIKEVLAAAKLRLDETVQALEGRGPTAVRALQDDIHVNTSCSNTGCACRAAQLEANPS
jgi:hypothetical protein